MRHGFALRHVDELDSIGRQTSLGQAVLEDAVQGGVGVQGFLAATKNQCIATLDAQGGGVSGDVGPSFVDEQHDAERDGHLRDVRAVGPHASLRRMRPTGSGRAATARSPSATARRRSGVSRSRSNWAAVNPNSTAAVRSRTLAWRFFAANGHGGGGAEQPVILAAPGAMAEQSFGGPGAAAQLGAIRLQVGRYSLADHCSDPAPAVVGRSLTAPGRSRQQPLGGVGRHQLKGCFGGTGAPPLDESLSVIVSGSARRRTLAARKVCRSGPRRRGLRGGSSWSGPSTRRVMRPARSLSKRGRSG